MAGCRGGSIEPPKPGVKGSIDMGHYFHWRQRPQKENSVNGGFAQNCPCCMHIHHMMLE